MNYEQQLNQLKVLAGIYKPYDVYQHQENISYTGQEKGEYQRKNNIEPGTPEWFKLWFSRPQLTGENPFGDKK